MPETEVERNGRLVMRHLAAENAHGLEETLATLHPQCIFEDLALGRTFHGRDGAAAYYRTWWNAFATEVKNVRSHWTTEGNLIGEAMYLGRHDGEFFGLAATGRSFMLRFAVFVEFRDDFMLGERFYYDLSSLLSQLGATRLPDLV